MQTEIENQFVVHTATDAVTMEQILAAIKYWFSHPEFDPSKAVIWDLNDTFVHLTLEEMRNAYSMVRDRVDSRRAGGRTAWVHSSAMVRAMIEIVSEEFEWGSQWSTFEHVEWARQWCQDEPNQA